MSRGLGTVLRAGGLVLLVVFSPASRGSQDVTLAWDPSTDGRVAGYLVHYGLVHRRYSFAIDAGNVTTSTITGLRDGLTYYFAVTAYTSNRLESAFSNEADFFAKRPRSRLTVITNSFGTVLPDLNGSNLVVGKTYELRAFPGTGKVFAGWSGDVTAATKRLTFVMRSNLVLRANFAAHPFAGAYNGLFFERDEARSDSSGFMAAKVETSGHFTATLRMAGTNYDLSGALDLQGEAQVRVNRAGGPPLTLNLHLDRLDAADQLIGRVSDGSWEAELVANRAISDAVPDFGSYAGRYTLALSASPDLAAGPPGSGLGAVVVNRKGKVSLVAELADGQTVTQTASLSRRGEWPFYASLYGGRGSILGWLTFTNQATNDLVGLLNWIRPSRLAARYYPLGFTNQDAVVGSYYDPNRLLDLTAARLVWGRDDSGESFTNEVTLVGAKLLADRGELNLDCAIDPTSGVFRGRFVDPGTGMTNRLRGVLLQKQNRGAGYFRGPDQMGWIRLEPE